MKSTQTVSIVFIFTTIALQAYVRERLKKFHYVKSIESEKVFYFSLKMSSIITHAVRRSLMTTAIRRAEAAGPSAVTGHEGKLQFKIIDKNVRLRYQSIIM